MQNPNDPSVESESEKLNGQTSTSDFDLEDSSSTSVPGSILQNLIFLNWVQFPPLPRIPDLSDPSKFSFNKNDDNFDTSNICHLYISTRVGVADTCKLGAWYMLPTHSSGRVETLSSADTVVLYLHGNGSNRSHPHR